MEPQSGGQGVRQVREPDPTGTAAGAGARDGEPLVMVLQRLLFRLRQVGVRVSALETLVHQSRVANEEVVAALDSLDSLLQPLDQELQLLKDALSIDPRKEKRKP